MKQIKTYIIFNNLKQNDLLLEKYLGKNTLNDFDKSQCDLAYEFEAQQNIMPRDKEKKRGNILKTLTVLLECREIVFNVFKNRICSIQPSKGTGCPGIIARVAKVSDCLSLKTSTPK